MVGLEITSRFDGTVGRMGYVVTIDGQDMLYYSYEEAAAAREAYYHPNPVATPTPPAGYEQPSLPAPTSEREHTQALQNQKNEYEAALTKLQTYDKFIQNGQFKGSEQDYADYQAAYKNYEKEMWDWNLSSQQAANQLSQTPYANEALHAQRLHDLGIISTDTYDKYREVAEKNVQTRQDAINQQKKEDTAIQMFNVSPTIATINELDKQGMVSPQLKSQMIEIAQKNEQEYQANLKANAIANQAISMFNVSPTSRTVRELSFRGMLTTGLEQEMLNIATSNEMGQRSIGRFSAAPTMATIADLKREGGISSELEAEMEGVILSNYQLRNDMQRASVLFGNALTEFQASPTFNTIASIREDYGNVVSEDVFKQMEDIATKQNRINMVSSMPLPAQLTSTTALFQSGILSKEDMLKWQLDIITIQTKQAALGQLNLTPTTQKDILEAQTAVNLGIVTPEWFAGYKNIAEQNILTGDILAGKAVTVPAGTEINLGKWGLKFGDYKTGTYQGSQSTQAFKKQAVEVFYDLNANNIFEPSESKGIFDLSGQAWATQGMNPYLWGSLVAMPGGAEQQAGVFVPKIQLRGLSEELTGNEAKAKMNEVTEAKIQNEFYQALLNTGYVGSGTAGWVEGGRRAAFEGLAPELFPFVYKPINITTDTGIHLDRLSPTKANIRDVLFPTTTPTIEDFNLPQNVALTGDSNVPNAFWAMPTDINPATGLGWSAPQTTGALLREQAGYKGLGSWMQQGMKPYSKDLSITEGLQLISPFFLQGSPISKDFTTFNENVITGARNIFGLNELGLQMIEADFLGAPPEKKTGNFYHPKYGLMIPATPDIPVGRVIGSAATGTSRLGWGVVQLASAMPLLPSAIISSGAKERAVGAVMAVGGLPAMVTARRDLFSTDPGKALGYTISELALMGYPVAKRAGYIPSIESVKWTTTKGADVPVWKGLTFRDKPVVGTSMGKWQLGTPTLDVGAIGKPKGVLTTTGTELNIMLKNIGQFVPEADAIKYQNYAVLAQELGYQKVPAGKFIEQTQTFRSPESVPVTLKFAIEQKAKVYGSFAQWAQMPKSKTLPLAADIDIMLSGRKTPIEAEGVSNILFKQLQTTEGIQNVRRIGTLIETKQPSGVWRHAVDIHFDDILDIGNYPEGIPKKLGVEVGQPSVKISSTVGKVPSMSLSEQMVNKVASSATVWKDPIISKEGINLGRVSPEAHRAKDIFGGIIAAEYLTWQKSRGLSGLFHRGSVGRATVALVSLKGIKSVRNVLSQYKAPKLELDLTPETLPLTKFGKRFGISSRVMAFSAVAEAGAGYGGYNVFSGYGGYNVFSGYGGYGRTIITPDILSYPNDQYTPKGSKVGYAGVGYKSPSPKSILQSMGVLSVKAYTPKATVPYKPSITSKKGKEPIGISISIPSKKAEPSKPIGSYKYIPDYSVPKIVIGNTPSRPAPTNKPSVQVPYKPSKPSVATPSIIPTVTLPTYKKSPSPSSKPTPSITPSISIPKYKPPSVTTPSKQPPSRKPPSPPPSKTVSVNVPSINIPSLKPPSRKPPYKPPSKTYYSPRPPPPPPRQILLPKPTRIIDDIKKAIKPTSKAREWVVRNPTATLESLKAGLNIFGKKETKKKRKK